MFRKEFPFLHGTLFADSRNAKGIDSNEQRNEIADATRKDDGTEDDDAFRFLAEQDVPHAGDENTQHDGNDVVGFEVRKRAA